MHDLDDAFFQNSERRMQALRERLSEAALESLARDVVQRLSTRTLSGRDGDLENPDAADIEALTTALISAEPEVARRMMQRLQKRGLTLDTLYSKYLAAAASRLGTLWNDDVITFVEVTAGVGRVFELINMLRRALPPPRITRAEPVLFTSVPGEDHGVGVEMAAELFRQHGWDVQVLFGADQDTILAEIGKVSAVVLGLSSGGQRTAEALARLIHCVRLIYPNVYIIVSGQIVSEEPELVELMMPDSAVATVEDALATIETLRFG
ncbi:cobalamin B12-binding domain-containing protein [Aestuariicoccus sp. MJ-SS9]|uniref:cobalamin B12-binding domain-containing protein n=1 Tax=Aestuariicoccus sp. MJ-SS9 TaxID=3079855 RepID=UPI00291172A1|nr:cobalamin B12-binding domain-containing protein [Aestuariicoccus sp. MJ-SS9]MDU8912756.1 cobalamin B12-binding domain-containing protein [Aestuariicoccus sp. MJ-SS9]